MNKAELEAELEKTKKLLADERKNNAFLLNEQKKYVNMAQEAGSELAPYKAMVTRLDEELTKVKSILKNTNR